MSHRVTYRTDAWIRAASGAPELRQVITVDLDATTRVVVGAPVSAEGSIQQLGVGTTSTIIVIDQAQL